VRHHQDAYDGVIARLTPARRRVLDDILAGLRFVRNRIGDEADLARVSNDHGLLTPGRGLG